jgi:hypothetical protein
MPVRAEPKLVIVDGGFESLIASMIIEPAESAIAWFVGGGGDDVEEARRTSAKMQADVLGFADFIDPEPDGRPWEAFAGGFGQSTMLLAAVSLATRLKCRRVIWPKCAAGDLESMLDASDRVLLVQRLALIEQERTSSLDVQIDTPLLDLSDAQTAELAADLNAPIWSCWWRLDQVSQSREARTERTRWEAALEKAHADWLLELRPEQTILSQPSTAAAGK